MLYNTILKRGNDVLVDISFESLEEAKVYFYRILMDYNMAGYSIDILSDNVAKIHNGSRCFKLWIEREVI